MAISAIPMFPGKPALDEILPRIPITARLAGLALTFSVSIGIPLGVLSAVKQGTRLDYILRVASLSWTVAAPAFWLGLLILMASVVAVWNHADFQPPPEDLDRGLCDLLPCPRWRSAFPQRRADDADRPLLDA